MMKKIVSFMAVIGLSMILVACGSTDNDETTVQKNPKPVENSNEGTEETSVNESNQNSTEDGQNSVGGTQDEMFKQMGDIDYAEFTLEVEYADQTEYEAELEENSNNSVETEIKDSINNVNLSGAEAFDELYPLVKELTINQQTVKEEAISETLKVFSLDETYHKFELELTFKDGTKIEFEDRK